MQKQKSQPQITETENESMDGESFVNTATPIQVPQHRTFITAREASLYVRNLDDLYKALVLNWFFLPKRKSTCVNTEYLVGVMQKKYWVPKYPQLQLRPCVNQPVKDLCVAYLEQEAAQQAIDLGFKDSKHAPDKEWIIICLSTLNPNHQMFSKNYFPPTVPRKANVMLECSVENSNGFWESLPQSKKKGSLFKHLVGEDVYKQGKVAKLQATQDSIAKQLLELGLNSPAKTASPIKNPQSFLDISDAATSAGSKSKKNQLD